MNSCIRVGREFAMTKRAGGRARACKLTCTTTHRYRICIATFIPPGGKKMCLALVELEKAFDRVSGKL